MKPSRKPKIGLSMLYCLGESFPSLLKRLNKVNTGHIEIVDEGFHRLNKKRVDILKKVSESRGLEITVHAPFAGINIAVPNPTLRRAILKQLKKSIHFGGQLNCRLWVFHPGLKTGVSQFYPELEWKLNLESTKILLRIGREEGVRIAIENVPDPFPFVMKKVQDFSRFYDELNEDIGLVLDVAHANLNGQIHCFIEEFHERIVHMHVSDNDGNNDLHLGIGHGSIDWMTVANSIKKVHYDNVITLESIENIEESLERLRQLFI